MSLINVSHNHNYNKVICLTTVMLFLGQSYGHNKKS
jgi:hypothetical protein